MSTPLERAMIDEGPYIYYEDSFRNVIEDHLPWLRTSERTQARPLEPAVAMRNNFDLYTLLLEMNIAPHLHWTIMRMNGYTSPEQFTADVTALMIPDTGDMETLRATFMTIHKIR